MVEYSYNSWGEQTGCAGTLSTALGILNPFRYRGYVYDEETGLYYLQSRYYDPDLCRFISVDVFLSTGQGVLGCNAFAYCLNNPVIMQEQRGSSPELVGIILLLLFLTGCSNEEKTNEFEIQTTNNGNCYQYATDLPYGIIGKGLYYPGYANNYRDTYKFTNASELKNAIAADYFANKNNDIKVEIFNASEDDFKNLKDGEWVIAYCYSADDFHFLRYDPGVGWTHKKGWAGNPSRLDWAGSIITDLSTANLGPYSPDTILYLKIVRSSKQ